MEFDEFDVTKPEIRVMMLKMGYTLDDINSVYLIDKEVVVF